MPNRSAFRFVIIGIVNLFADLAYEGARGSRFPSFYRE
jgi:hypothetical protein